MRIAVLGGSFDPVHNGHLAIAKQALKHLPIDAVWFMPTRDTPLKERVITPFAQRAAMISLAISPYRKMHLCTLENEREGTSFTIDTVEELKHRYPFDSFCWLIGWDQAVQLSSWKEPDRLLELIDIYVVDRDTKLSAVRYPVHFLSMPLVEVSSTEIRHGNKLWMLPYAVRRFIADHGLYAASMVQSAMSEYRLQHSRSVAQLCVELAKIHHVNAEKAYLSGMFHDVCKQWPKEASAIWMRHLEPQHMQEHPNVWHGYIASKFVKRYFCIHDKEILFAIRHHVKGSSRSKLAMILYVADKLDPARGYDSNALIALCKKDLQAGFAAVWNEQQIYLKTHGKKGDEHE